jgi:hypothetical protein
MCEHVSSSGSSRGSGFAGWNTGHKDIAIRRHDAPESLFLGVGTLLALGSGEQREDGLADVQW